MDNLPKGKQKYYNALNKAILALIKKNGKWKRVAILSIRDDYICIECDKIYGKVINIDEATIPPVPNCKNPICRCIYQAEE